MQPQTAWATGFLTQILLDHLRNRYPSQIQGIDPRAFLSGIEGYESLKDPEALLRDSHAWLPEEVLREVLRTAERVSGRKDIAYEAALDYFSRSSDHRAQRSPSIFEIIVRIFDDVRTVTLCSNLWAGAYTTFMKLQAITRDPAAHELIILSQCDERFQPLIATHFMLKGNYEGFIRLYDFVEGGRLEEEFLQYRIREIVGEFEGYTVQDSGPELKILDRQKKTTAVFQPVPLGDEEIPLKMEALGGLEPLVYGSFSDEGGSSKGHDGLILHPHKGSGRVNYFRVLVPPRNSSRVDSGERSETALRVIKGGTLRSGSLEYVFREGSIYEAPYSRYRFHWIERRRPAIQGASLESRIQKLTLLLFDYLKELKATQQRLLAYAVENKALTAENIYLRREMDQEWSSRKFLGDSPPMQAVLRLVEQVAPTDSTVLITGETGTGKELVARLIHGKSRRRSGRFVAVNCAAIPEGLLESELFGHEKGAFTGAVGRKLGRFEWAHQGTLFLDEIGDISPVTQVKLLRVLQEQEFERVGGDRVLRTDVRVIAATNRNLEELVASGQFRKDLYYRLNVIPIHLPPLRERLEDLSVLAEHFLVKYATKLRKRLKGLSGEALAIFRGYAWPGNVRELENIMERVVTLAPSDQMTLTAEMLPAELCTGSSLRAQSAVLSPFMAEATAGYTHADLMEKWMEQMEWSRIVDLVSMEGSMDSFLRKIEWGLAKRAIRVYGNKSEAARALKRTYRWIRKLEKQMETPMSSPAFSATDEDEDRLPS
jgi:transcriptional regulator with GAF, ATPase, and Fis domain